MKSYRQWREQSYIESLYKEDAEFNEIREAFMQLRKSIVEASKTQSWFDWMKNSKVGKYVSDKYKSTTDMIGRIRDKDRDADRKAYDADVRRLKSGRSEEDDWNDIAAGRYPESSKESGVLLVEWQKNALETIMSAVDRAEQVVMTKMQQYMAQPRHDLADVRKNADGTYDTNFGDERGRDYQRGAIATSATYDPKDANLQLIKTIKPDVSSSVLRRLESSFEQDPVLKALAEAISGKKAAFRTKLVALAKEHYKMSFKNADEVVAFLDEKYQTNGALAKHFSGKTANMDDPDVQQALKTGKKADREIQTPLNRSYDIGMD